MMVHNHSLDVVLDVAKASYQKELFSLFQSLDTTPCLTSGQTVSQVTARVFSTGNRHCLYISDGIDEEKLRAIRSSGIARLDCLLLVDHETNSLVSNKPGLTYFNHILSCTDQHIPNQQLMSTVRRIREQQFFGVDKCLTQAAHINRYMLGQSDQRHWFRDALYAFVQGLSTVVRRPTDSYAQFAVEVQEELLMNAIWDANPKLRNADRRVPVTLLPQETVQVEWGFDGTHLALGVQDPFGTFEFGVLDKYIKFLFTSDRRQLLRPQEETAGAGIGLFMVMERLNAITINVAAAKATEVIAILDLTSSPSSMNKRQRSFQFFTV